MQPSWTSQEKSPLFSFFRTLAKTSRHHRAGMRPCDCEERVMLCAYGTHRSRQNLSEKSLNRPLRLYIDTECIVFGSTTRTRRTGVNGLTIRQVTKRARVHVDTLRCYERRGLLVKPLRSKSNYRQDDRHSLAIAP
jgi:MerR family regulatory protein